MATYNVQGTSLTAVADAIRAKSGGSESLEFPDGFVSEIEGISGGVKYTRYTLDGDTRLVDLLSEINYEVSNVNYVAIYIRASGDVVPTSGNYVLNNYIFIWINGSRVYGRHYYISMNQHPSPNSFPDLPNTNEGDSNVSIVDGVLTFTATSSSSCLGTTGDVVTIAEISIEPDNIKMNGGIEGGDDT